MSRRILIYNTTQNSEAFINTDSLNWGEVLNKNFTDSKGNSIKGINFIQDYKCVLREPRETLSSSSALPGPNSEGVLEDLVIMLYVEKMKAGNEAERDEALSLCILLFKNHNK